MLFLHLNHKHEPTHDPGLPTHDPAMNPVRASTTFDAGQFLANNVGIMATHADMLPKFPTKQSHQHHKLYPVLYTTILFNIFTSKWLRSNYEVCSVCTSKETIRSNVHFGIFI